MPSATKQKKKFKTGNNEQETVILICITINYCYEARLRFEMYIISIEEIERVEIKAIC